MIMPNSVRLAMSGSCAGCGANIFAKSSIRKYRMTMPARRNAKAGCE